MVLKIYGVPASTCTQAVAITLEEINKHVDLPYEITKVDFLGGEHKTKEYLEMKQPFGQIPVLFEEDGFRLFESRAISRYLILKYAPNSGLIPQDLRANALFEQAMSIENNNFYGSASGLAMEKVVKPIRGGTTDEAKAEELAKTLEAKLVGYEAILSKQKYLAGDNITLADLLHLPYTTILTNTAGFKGFVDTEKLPNVARWYADISSRESWKVVNQRGQEYIASLRK